MVNLPQGGKHIEWRHVCAGATRRVFAVDGFGNPVEQFTEVFAHFVHDDTSPTNCGFHTKCHAVVRAEASVRTTSNCERGVRLTFLYIPQFLRAR